MQISYIVNEFENTLVHLKRTQAKLDIMQKALGRFDALSDPEYSAGEGSYHYIPYDLGDFIDCLTELDGMLRKDPYYRHPTLPYRPIRFLEVGCGIGRNLFVVKHGSGLTLKSVTGIDIARPYIAQAKRFFFLDDEAQVGDALTFDYSQYDVIYFYRPFCEEKLETRFEKRLVKQMHPGAYVLGQLNSYLERAKTLEERDVSARIWRKRTPETNGTKKAR